MGLNARILRDITSYLCGYNSKTIVLRHFWLENTLLKYCSLIARHPVYTYVRVCVCARVCKIL
jgi:hypothetical protein